MASVIPEIAWSARPAFWIMSHDVQPSPIASDALAAALPSSPPAGQGLRRWPAAANGRSEATGHARDSVTPQKSGLSGRFHGPATDSRPRPARWNRPSRSRQAPGFSPPPPGLPRATPSRDIRKQAGAHRAARAGRKHQADHVSCQASPAANDQPGHSPPPACAVPRMYLASTSRTCAATGRRPAPRPCRGIRFCMSVRFIDLKVLDLTSTCGRRWCGTSPGCPPITRPWSRGP